MSDDDASGDAGALECDCIYGEVHLGGVPWKVDTCDYNEHDRRLQS